MKNKFRKCVNEFRVAWLDENMEHYKVEIKLNAATCLHESYLSYFPVTGPAEIPACKRLNPDILRSFTLSSDSLIRTSSV